MLYGRVGYIDSAIPTSQFRVRFDASYNDTRPSRAEFIYARDALARNGPFLAPEERRIDYQELSAYLEYAFGPRFSVFFESPYRMLNPEVNPDHSGFGDLNAGFKYAFLRDEDRVATFQLRTYAPTGDLNDGLGTGHTTLEPALLLYQRLTDRLAFEGELRYWAPIGGTDFAGDIIRYGLGLDYDLVHVGRVEVSPGPRGGRLDGPERQGRRGLLVGGGHGQERGGRYDRQREGGGALQARGIRRPVHGLRPGADRYPVV